MESICPICYKKRIRAYHIKGHKLYRCDKCSLFFSAHIPKQIDVYYNEKANLQKAGDGEWNSLRWGQRWYLQSHVSGDSLLDIGCGNGNFLSACEKRRITVYGYDISEIITKHNRNVGHMVYNNISDISDSSYDVVTMWEVLEHTNAPNTLIRETRRVLKDGGKLYISTPNFNHHAVNNTSLKKYWPPFHLTFWNKKSLLLFMSNNGFRIEKIKYRPFNTYLIKKDSLFGCLGSVLHEFSLIGMEILIVATKEGDL